MEVINVIVEMKQRNPRYGYRRIAMQVSNSFGVDIDKDVVLDQDEDVIGVVSLNDIAIKWMKVDVID